ncbi:prephenate dehydrogenase [Acetitomaculum ruminis DSM 5522]|uniref:Prephenate dehydrogenase n=1 Tax=Acetitomaculum ruminis DSM 5522 TaxID=1120918 RepID=A0A1I0VHI4_9FIRM|nr:prephenate dehydrogenase [Acetitomaculum ruminis]SFA75771.1 prephenate dehydrogenase [Acetitomaculum ruminis DSM 5522]
MDTFLNLDIKIGFVGLGLIGGSIAKAIRKVYGNAFINAFDISRESLEAALSDKTVNHATDKIDDSFYGCDYIFLCASVKTNTTYLDEIKKYLTKDTILTDVGSVKNNIHAYIQKAGLSDYFIGGHPMAGAEKSGYKNSKAHLIENAYYVISPEKNTSHEKIEKYSDFIKSLGAIPIVLDYRDHDHITGTISHLPHIIAAGLVNYVKKNDDSREMMRTLAAGGFKDMTRIASSSADMWKQICLANKDNILNVMDSFMDELKDIRKIIEDSDIIKLEEFFSNAREYRNSMPIKGGAFSKAYEIYVDLVDQAGAIAPIATILGINGINIKNIGIINNREFIDGVLRIEFESEKDLDDASKLLSSYNYKIQTR